jgi:hypothetical protein
MKTKQKKQISIENTKGRVILYKNKLEVRLGQDTVWLTQKQMAELFQKDVRTINEHIKNVFKEGELLSEAVIRKFRITASDGKGYDTAHYNLDVIISVGYRAKSLRGTQFRVWATNVLRQHLVEGYTINSQFAGNSASAGQRRAVGKCFRRSQGYYSNHFRILMGIECA